MTFEQKSELRNFLANGMQLSVEASVDLLNALEAKEMEFLHAQKAIRDALDVLAAVVDE